MTSRLIATLCLLVLFAPLAHAEEWAPGLPIDTPFPDIAATGQSGEAWDNEALSGENGLLFLFNRSAAW